MVPPANHRGHDHHIHARSHRAAAGGAASPKQYRDYEVSVQPRHATPRAEGDGVEYLLPDALGSVRQIADVNGYLLRTQDYEPYGSVLNSSGSGQSAYGFAGEQIDTTGLIYLRARYAADAGYLPHAHPWSGMMRPIIQWIYLQTKSSSATDPSGKCPFAGSSCLLAAGCNGSSGDSVRP
jgi:hypothetical protein